ncbi:hypothetical protein ACSTLL_23495, partial [Vibrio parahaemolyticus]
VIQDHGYPTGDREHRLVRGFRDGCDDEDPASAALRGFRNALRPSLRAVDRVKIGVAPVGCKGERHR